MLSERFDGERLSEVLIPREQWRPFPTAQERGPWEAIVESVRGAHVRRGELALEAKWPVLPATLFLDYARTGNRCRFEDPQSQRRSMLRDLVLAECVEGQGRFVDAIAAGVWLTCDESWWGMPAHMGMQRAGVGLPDVDEPVVDLFAAETAALLAWTVSLVGAALDGVSPLIRPHVSRRCSDAS